MTFNFVVDICAENLITEDIIRLVIIWQ